MPIVNSHHKHTAFADPTAANVIRHERDVASVDAAFETKADTLLAVFEFVRDHGRQCTSARRIANAIGVPRTHVEGALSILYRAGLVNFSNGKAFAVN